MNTNHPEHEAVKPADTQHHEGSKPRRATRWTALTTGAILLSTLTAIGVANAAAIDNDVVPLNWFQDERVGEVGSGARTVLHRDDDSVSVSVHARDLEPGEAHTTWLVIFNAPDGCEGDCSEDDLFQNAANPSVVFSGGSGVVTPSGTLNVHGSLTEGDPNPEGAQTLFGPGLVDAQTAEIHIVVRNHGPASADAATLEAQLTTFEGNCTPGSSFGMGTGPYDCYDPQVSIHFAPSA